MIEYSKKFYLWFVGALGLLVGCSSPLFADTLFLNNGGKFTGTVKRESATHVTLDLGGGTISIRKSNIKSISKTVSEQTNWKPISGLNELDPPNELSDVALAYKNAKTARFAAIQEKNKARVFKRERKSLMRRYAQQEKYRNQVATEVNSVNPNNNVTKYNRLVHQQNQLTNELNTIQVQLTKDAKAFKAGKKIVERYLKTLDTLKSDVQASKSRLAKIRNKEQAKSFWLKVEKKLTLFDNDFKSLDVPHKKEGEHMIINVRINDRVEGRFLLDTGASYITLSENMAKRLNLKLDDLPTLPLEIADGSIIEARPLVLDSVKVGDAQVNAVMAVVLPSKKEQYFDGLLGMSFLREFVINFDPINKKLVFKRFNP